MQSILTVTSASNTYDLTVAATVKTELGISGTSEDAKIETWIHQASAIFAVECNRVFAQETVSEQFRNTGGGWVGPIALQRYPVASITSVTEDDDDALSASDYELDAETGLLWRLDTSGYRMLWCARKKIVVVYVGGYQLLTTLPQEIERAVIDYVKQMRFAATKDPALKGEEVIGVQRFDYRVSGGGDDGVYPPQFDRMIQKYRRPLVA